MTLLSNEVPLSTAALKSGMDEKTARKYRRAGRLPTALRARHDWRSRPDPFAEVWPELKELFQDNPGLQATTLLAELQRREPGRFSDGQLRTLQRKLKTWRAREVFQSTMAAVTKSRPLARYRWFSKLRSRISPRRLKNTALARALRDSPLFNPAWTRRRNSTFCSQLRVKRVRSIRPTLRSATAIPFCRG